MTKLGKQLFGATTALLLILGIAFFSLVKSCEEGKARRVDECMARHLLGETNQVNPHLGCLRKKKDGHWEKVPWEEQ